MFHALDATGARDRRGVLRSARGCGGVEREPSLAKAIERTQATGSHRIEMTALGVEQGTKIDTVCEGALDYERDRLRFSCDQLEIVVVGQTTYVKSGAFGDGSKWTKSLTDEDDPLEELSPEALFSVLRAAANGAGRRRRGTGRADRAICADSGLRARRDRRVRRGDCRRGCLDRPRWLGSKDPPGPAGPRC